MIKSLHRYYTSQGNEHQTRWVFRWLQETGRDGVDVTWSGRAFQVQGVVIGKAQSLPVECVCLCVKKLARLFHS